MNEAPSATASARRCPTSLDGAELSRVDLGAPIVDAQSLDVKELAALYRKASLTAELDGQEIAALAYALLQGLLEMHFQPADRAEPFTALVQWADGRRSMALTDISRDLAGALAQKVAFLGHSTVRARVADICWTVNRRLGECAGIAVDAYCESVEQARVQALNGDVGTIDDGRINLAEQLLRACQIAIATKGKLPFPQRLADLVRISRDGAFTGRHLHEYYEVAGIDLDFDISPAAGIAEQAEQLVEDLCPSATGYTPQTLIELGARAFRRAGDEEGYRRLTVKAAEWCVSCADTLKHAPMLETHWLTRAIAIYGQVTAERRRRTELRKRLVDTQARSLDAFVPSMVPPIDITEIVITVREAVTDKPLATALRFLLDASRSPDREKLRLEVGSRMERSLAALFSRSVLDKGGKVKYEAPGKSDDPHAKEAALRHRVIEQECVRRGLTTRSTLEPARAVINAEHNITAEKLLPLLHASPFIEPGYEYVFARGFARWFGGDHISATSILVPQLENSLRYVLGNAGEDVSTVKSDGTQEDRSIQALFDHMRDAIVRVLGEPITYEIENLFLFRGGPAIRHAVAHGQFSTGHFYSDDASYACWLILRLTFLPLFATWCEVESYLNEC